MGCAEVEAFLTHLAVDQQAAASTQNQALGVLLFLYRDVLKTPLNLSIDAIRAKKPRGLPTVLTKDETLKVIERLCGPQRLMAKLLYGGGLRLMECLRLRVKTLDFAQRTTTALGAITEVRYLTRLKADRTVWLDGGKVQDVTTQPAFTGNDW